jgi:hypothetical protein
VRHSPPLTQEVKKLGVFAQPELYHLRATDHLAHDRCNLAGELGVANPRRRQNHQTRGPEETASALRFDFARICQRTVRLDVIVIATPFDISAKEAQNKNEE